MGSDIKSVKRPRGFGIGRLVAHSRRMWGLCSHRQMLVLIFALVLMATASFLNSLIPIWVGELVDRIGQSPSDSESLIGEVPVTVLGWIANKPVSPSVSSQGAVAVVFVVAVATVLLAGVLLDTLYRYVIDRCRASIVFSAGIALSHRVLRMDLTWLATNRAGSLQSRVSDSVGGMKDFLSGLFGELVPAVLQITIALTVVCTQNLGVACVTFVVLLFSYLITRREMSALEPYNQQLQDLRESVDAVFLEQIGSLEYVRAADTLSHEIDRLGVFQEKHWQTIQNRYLRRTLFGTLRDLNEKAFFLVILAVTTGLAIRGSVEVGSIVKYLGLYHLATNPLKVLYKTLLKMNWHSVRLDRYFTLMDRPIDDSFNLPTIREPQLSSRVPAIVTEAVAVDYHLEDGAAKRVINNVWTEIGYGETVGIAGPAGCGKSTWLKALLRLVHPSSGTILLGGQPIYGISRQDIGRLVGYVSQTPFVFAGSIAENVAYGSPNATQGDIERACDRSGIHEEVVRMPGGYSFRVAEQGRNLSGGQRQKLALARVFLKDPPILILDEATSALDAVSQRQIHETLRNSYKGRTMIMIAHRLATLRSADRILVFQEGQIVESGPYEELVAQGGVFAKLVESAELG